MTPEKINTIVMLLMVGSVFMILANMNKKHRIFEVGLFGIALCAQAYYASIAVNTLSEILFTILWGYFVYRSWERNYAKD